ncbi:MAG: glycosyl hydrolase family 17 protein [Saprospiraceae bacterium]
MSYREERLLALTEVDHLDYVKSYSKEDMPNVFLEILHNGLHGLCFSIYQDEQMPGDIISPLQVQRRLQVIQPYTKWVRSFSCIDGNENVPKIAKELGMNTLAGAWIGTDLEKNDKEIENLIQLSNAGLVDIAAIGNEVMYRKELSEEQIINYINYFKSKVKNVPVGYVDAYYEFSKRPALTDTCDIILANCYPFWESYPIELSLFYLKKMYYQAVEAGAGKRVVITETGWPSKGSALKAAEPSEINALLYFINAQLWAMDAGVEMFYFSSFDEEWKVASEGDLGAYWGLWDKHENLKFALL